MTADRDISNEAMLARLEERIAGVKADVGSLREESKAGHSALNKRMSELEGRERERNGHIAELLHRQDEHDKWHGTSDINVAARISDLEEVAQANHDADLLEQGAADMSARQKALITGAWNSLGGKNLLFAGALLFSGVAGACVGRFI